MTAASRGAPDPTAPHEPTSAPSSAVQPAGAIGIGIDVGGTSTRVVVLDADGSALHSSVAPTPSGPQALVDHLAAEIATAAVLGEGRPAWVGVGIPGGVHDDVVSTALNLGIVEPLPLGAILTSRTGLPTAVENDVNAAALGAWARLGADPNASLTYLSIGTGFAAGTVVGGQLVRGGRGLAGEIGHVPYPHHTARCGCGQTGCIETIVSGQALTSRMQATDLGTTATDLWAAADAGNPDAIRLRAEFVEVLAWASQVALMLLDVDAVAIGGGVGVALGERLVGDVRARLADRHRSAPWLTTLSSRVVAVPTGVELGALGADIAARRRFAGPGVPS